MPTKHRFTKSQRRLAHEILGEADRAIDQIPAEWFDGFATGMLEMLKKVRRLGALKDDQFANLRAACDEIDAEPSATYDLFSRAGRLMGNLRRLNDVRRNAETPAKKAAATRQIMRTVQDEALAVELAALIRGGDTTETARAKLKDPKTGAPIGDVRARRIRAVAVRMGLLQAQQRTRKPSR